MGYRPPCEKPKTRSKKAPWGNRKRSRRRRHTRKTKLSTVLSVPKIIPKILPKILPEIIPPKSFVYSPLDTNDTDAFRLLKVLPGVWDAPIQCILIHHIRSAPRIPYEALSYTWGDFNPTEEIFINGRLFLVTPNLKSALQNLRSDNMSTKGIRTLWIDAICIDQSELSERNHQVRQMQEIYAGAERVLVWLGPASGDSGTAIRFIKTVYSILTKTNSHTFASRSKFEVSRFEREDFDVLDFYNNWSDGYTWTSTVRLLSRNWWDRAWIIQEVASAKDVLCCCGQSTVPWDQLALIIRAIGMRDFRHFNTEIKSFMDNGGIDKAWNLVEARETFQTRGFKGIQRLLDMNRRHACRDPRDKIYSILGLTDERIRTIIRPDYKKSIAWTYAMAVKAHIMGKEDLEILALVEDKGRARKVHDRRFPRPSWVPDFRKRGIMWPFLHSGELFSASGLHSKCSASFSNDLKTLSVEGICLDIVKDNNVQSSRMLFRFPKSLWEFETWQLDDIVHRLLEDGGVKGAGEIKPLERPTEGRLKSWEAIANEERRRNVETALYTVMVAGHLYTEKGLQPCRIKYSASENVQNLRPSNATRVLWQAQHRTEGRTLILSENRHLGLVPFATKKGDRIFILYGLHVPVILRPNKDGSYAFIGVAYVYGVMHGEALTSLYDGVYKPEKVALR
jgi:Heterokaryon incompatibility protein (HET)